MGTLTGDDMCRAVLAAREVDCGAGVKADEIAIVEKRSIREERMAVMLFD